MATTITTSPVSHDAIINAVIIVISEESNKPVTLDSKLADDLDLDSLDFVNVAQQLEERLGLGPIPDSDLFKLVTVEQVVLYCEAWLKQKSEVASAVAAQG